MDFERGSEWRRWDLHLHTASSYDYKYKEADSDELLAAALKENKIAAVAITDHFVIDKNRIENLRKLAPDTIFFPGVELRTDKGDTNIHVILIFSDEIDLNELVADFNHFIKEAKNRDDNEKIYWDYNCILKFANEHDAMITVHAGRKTNGVDDRISNALGHNQAVKEEYAKNISAFEMGQPRDLVDYREHVFPEIGIKPMIICSDNHDPRIYEPKYKLWIKADLTFNGLKQIMYEPEDRVCISDTKPDYKQNYYIIDSVQFVDEAFSPSPIKFNENLTCVIGGKSTGKSILIHNLAETIDEVQVELAERKSGTSTKTVDNVIVNWADGKDDEKRKIIYIPQTYLNRLSDEKENTTKIDELIENVILVDSSIKNAYEKMLGYINTNKRNVNQIILDLISNNRELSQLNNSLKELGTKSGIEEEIQRLENKKSELSKSSKITVEELARYELSLQKLTDTKSEISTINNEIEQLKITDSIVTSIEFEYDYCDITMALLKESRERTIEAANLFWESEKSRIIDILNSKMSELQICLDNSKKTVDELKDKVEENNAISEVSKNITKEKEKLSQYNDLAKKRDTLKNKEEEFTKRLCETRISYETIHGEYAKVINENPSLKNDELEFSVNVPFKSEAFLTKFGELFDNRNQLYKELKSETDIYTNNWLEKIIRYLLNDNILLKSGYDTESALREIFGNWFGIKYVVKMDHDTIDVMSPGKKALVLLKLLIDLAESKCPILIDQPEDDLDNRSIFDDLIPFIKKKKKDRQIIIVTHNANVVLGADAEEVIIANQDGKNSPNKEYRFEYRSGSIENDYPIYDGERNIEEGILSGQGIQQHICDILEGGEKAFELRKNKYHI